jgi:hypothetical protein
MEKQIMSSGKKIALMETLTAPAREIVGRQANERRRVSGAHEARATMIGQRRGDNGKSGHCKKR